MPSPLSVRLSDEERTALTRIRDTEPKPYVRERAAALLKMDRGHSARDVAEHGLLKVRYHETPAIWWHRYQAEGIAGLRMHPGRGRKPSAPP